MRKALILVFIIGVVFAHFDRTSFAGYTTYDWLFSGPIHKWCITDTVANGIHICWSYSNFYPSTDLNARYNFYNLLNWNWHWIDGINVFTQRSAFSSMDNHPITGCIYIMGTMLAIDQGPGMGLFEYSQGPQNALSPIIAVSPDNVIHCLYLDAVSDTLMYSRNGSPPMHICPPAPEPVSPSYNFAGSKMSNKLIAVWTCAEDTNQERAYYRLSNDGGINWQPTAQLPFPPSQDIGPSFNSLYAMFDNQDNLHIVASVSDTTGYTAPAEIWHYCPTNSPQWSLIQHYDPYSIFHPTGYNAIFATRPTIVQNSRDNYLYVAWEQFDSLNYEPITCLARADIWIAESPNNGVNWYNQQSITTPNTTSKRFPCAGGVDHDTLTVAYLIDSIAGFDVYTQGPATRNPIVIQRIKVPLPAVEYKEISISPKKLSNEFVIYPNPAKTYFTIRLPQILHQVQNGNMAIKIFDVTGKVVKEIGDCFAFARNERIIRVPLDGIRNGVYFVKVGDKMINNKLIVTK